MPWCYSYWHQGCFLQTQKKCPTWFFSCLRTTLFEVSVLDFSICDCASLRRALVRLRSFLALMSWSWSADLEATSWRLMIFVSSSCFSLMKLIRSSCSFSNCCSKALTFFWVACQPTSMLTNTIRFSWFLQSSIEDQFKTETRELLERTKGNNVLLEERRINDI